MRVDAYRNLQNDCISLKSREPETRGRVVEHTDTAIVRDAEFVVQPAGRRRVIEEQRKNVHAFVRGVVDTGASIPPDGGVAVTYNPYEYESFVVRESERPIEAASLAVVSPAGVTAYEPEF